MKKGISLKLVLLLTGICILLPILVLILWSVAGRWPWPLLLPERYSLRTVHELLFGSARLPQLLLSSMALAGAVSLLGTAVGVLTAQATELHDFPGKQLVRFGCLLPLLIPGTVFAMGIQLVLIRLGLTDTVAGVVLVHLVVAAPYCILIMTDITRAVGGRYAEQAAVLGSGPLRAFFSVTLPCLMPGVLSSISMGFILSYSQYFTTLLIGGGRVKTLALVLVPYIQGGDRALFSVYSVVFVGSALLVFFLFEGLILNLSKGVNRHGAEH